VKEAGIGGDQTNFIDNDKMASPQCASMTANPHKFFALSDKNTGPRLSIFWLLLILLLGFGIRVTGLAWGQSYCYGSQGDCIEAYQVAADYARGDNKAQYLGQPNYNRHSKLPGPLWTLFCLGGLRLSGGSYEGPVWIIILMNTAAICLTYFLAKRTIGGGSALWAALFMAVSTGAVHYSVVVFNPVVMPFFGGLYLIALWRTTQIGNSKSIFWIPVLILGMMQFHMSGLMLIPAAVLVLAFSETRINPLFLAGGFAAGLALYVPYLQGEITHGWANTHGMMMGPSDRNWPGVFKVIIAPISFLVNIWTPGWAYTFAEYREMSRACFGNFGLHLAVNAWSLIAAAVPVSGAIIIVKKNLAGSWSSPRAIYARSPGLAFLTLNFLVPLLIHMMSGKMFQDRYCLVFLPALFSLAGGGTTYWLQKPAFRKPVLALVVISIASSAWFMPAMYHFQKSFIQNAPRLVPSLGKMEAVYQTLKTHAGGDRQVVVLDADYMKALSPDDKLLFQVGWIRDYAAFREAENTSRPYPPKNPVIYQLCGSEKVRQEDPGVAFYGNGVALVARPLPN
jgi:hypothetical protein